LSNDEKKRFFKSANTNLGSSFGINDFLWIRQLLTGISALCLSGGASFGYCEYQRLLSARSLIILALTDHCGVVKAFLDAALLPRVITGTSAGGLVAALVCTRTDDELKILLVPELANRITACEEPFSVWFRRVWNTGARFDSILYVSVSFPSSRPKLIVKWDR
jgi:predicted acylesterase/phospholipase RssA